MASSDPVTDCYRALVGEAAADTCCQRICVMVRRMQRDNDRGLHELHLMTLASQLMQATKSFGRHIVELYAQVEEGNYAAALFIGEAMGQHEAMLHEIAAGRSLHYGASIN